MNLARIKAQADAAGGWMNDAEGLLLYQLARKCSGKGVIVEIGSWKGRSTIWLGHGSRDGRRVTRDRPVVVVRLGVRGALVVTAAADHGRAPRLGPSRNDTIAG